MEDEINLTTTDMPALIDTTPIPKLSNFHTLFALDITNKLMSYPISSFFIKTTKNSTNTVPEYYSKIKSPQIIDLTIIKNKLENFDYSNLSEWKKDMNILWSNVLDFYPADSPHYIIANELKQKYQKMIAHVPNSEEDYWLAKITKQNKKIQKYCKQIQENEMNFANTETQEEEKKELENLQTDSKSKKRIQLKKSLED